MANNITPIDQLDILFAKYVQGKLNLPNGKVRISYQQKGQISSKIDEDVCYVKVFDEPDERHIWKNRKQEVVGDNIKVTQYSMRTLKVQFVFYGPNSDNNSTIINESFYFDSTKQLLYENNLALIPDRTEQPTIHYEKINEQWWQRSDLKIYLYNSISTEETLDIISDVDIKFNYGNGG